MLLGVLRVRQWAHFVVLPAAALGPDPVPLVPRIPSLLLGAAASAFSLAYAYGINAIFDRATDRDPHKNPLAGRGALPSSIGTVVALTALAALGFAVFAGSVALLAIVVSLLAGTVYSAGPRLKAWPIVGTALNAFIFGPLLWLALDDRPPPAAFGLLVSSFVVLLLQNQLLHERADFEEDVAARVLTTGRALGERGTAAAVVMLALGGIAASVFLAPRPKELVLAVLTLTLGATAAFPLSRPASARRKRHGAFAFVGGATLYLAQWLSS